MSTYGRKKCKQQKELRIAGEEGTTENGKDQSKKKEMVVKQLVEPEDRR